MTPTPVTECPCSCGEEVPKHGGNVWQKAKPYWAWICINPGCKWRDQEFHNQSGDRTCAMCTHKRIFVGHFDPKLYQGVSHYRITVLGEKVRRPKMHTFFHHGRGWLEGGDWHVHNEPVGDLESRNVF